MLPQLPLFNVNYITTQNPANATHTDVLTTSKPKPKLLSCEKAPPTTLIPSLVNTTKNTLAAKKTVREMTKVLKQKPQTLRSLLAAHQRDLEAQIRLHDDSAPQSAQLRSALAKVNAAIERLAASSNVEAAGDEDEDEDVVDDLDEAIDDEFDEDTVDDEDLSEVDEDDATESDDLEEEEEEEEPLSPREAARSAVKMNSRMRRQMGDPAADFLDDYAYLLHKKVTQFFKELDRKALMLGTEDDDGETSLRERLREEVGRRGIQALEPSFDEWRGMVIKNILKDVNNHFQPPPVEEPEPEVESPAVEAEGEAIESVTAAVIARPERVVSTVSMRPAGMGRVTLN